MLSIQFIFYLLHVFFGSGKMWPNHVYVHEIHLTMAYFKVWNFINKLEMAL